MLATENPDLEKLKEMEYLNDYITEHVPAK
jgi:hypothetical protein